MTAAEIALPLSGYIIGRSDGTFDGPLAEFEPGAIMAELMCVREIVADPMEEIGEVYDVVAWERGTTSPWWTRRGLVTVLGEHELQSAWWQDRPARMVATPYDHAIDPGTFCIIDWSADINAIIGIAPAVECASRDLERRLWDALTRQEMPKIPIRTVRPTVTDPQRLKPWSFGKAAA